MDISYKCFCQTMCETFNELLTHRLSCEFLQNASNDSEVLDRMSLTEISRPRMLETPGSEEEILKGNESEIKLKFVKTWAAFLEGERMESSDENLRTNLLGRKLPKRTKVPYLSRAIPLSSDHSYERCTCGAVFATRLGKRQHQARFCKLVKSKPKKPRNNGMIAEDKKASVVFQIADISSGPINCMNIIKKELSNVQQEFQAEETNFDVEHL